MLVVGRWRAGLRRQVAAAVGESCLVGDKASAAGSRDDLVSVERKDGGIAEGTSWSAAARRAEGLGGVLDDWDGGLAKEGEQIVVISALAIEVDHNGCGDAGAGSSSLLIASATNSTETCHVFSSASTSTGVAPQ